MLHGALPRLKPRGFVSSYTLDDNADLMAHPVTEVSSLSELANAVEHLRQSSGLVWWYRGHPSATWQLLPRVWREHSPSQERHLAHEFRARAGTRHSHRPAFDDYAGWLALMQHYGVPTRLLDWTRAPVIAAFFAVHPSVQPQALGDGTAASIWAVAPGRLNEDQGLEPLLYTLNAGELHGSLRPAFKEHACSKRVVAAVPFESDIRMQVQQGVFTVHTHGDPLEAVPGTSLWLHQFLIPADARTSMAREVDSLGLGLADIFPDLTSLAQELRTRHTRSPTGSPVG